MEPHRDKHGSPAVTWSGGAIQPGSGAPEFVPESPKAKGPLPYAVGETYAGPRAGTGEPETAGRDVPSELMDADLPTPIQPLGLRAVKGTMIETIDPQGPLL